MAVWREGGERGGNGDVVSPLPLSPPSPPPTILRCWWGGGGNGLPPYSGGGRGGGEGGMGLWFLPPHHHHHHHTQVLVVVAVISPPWKGGVACSNGSSPFPLFAWAWPLLLRCRFYFLRWVRSLFACFTISLRLQMHVQAYRMYVLLRCIVIIIFGFSLSNLSM